MLSVRDLYAHSHLLAEIQQGTLTCVVVVTMSNHRENQQQRERNVNNIGGDPRRNAPAAQHRQGPINPPMAHGNVVLNPVFVNPVPPMGNNVILNANPPLGNNVILNVDPPMADNHFNVVRVPHRRRGNRRRGNNHHRPNFPVVQVPAFIPPALVPPPAPPPAFIQPIVPIHVPSVLLPQPQVPIQAAFIPPAAPQPIVPIIPQQPAPPRQQPFLNLDPDLFPPRPNVGSMEPAAWNRPPPPPPPPGAPGGAPVAAPVQPAAPQGPPPQPQGPPPQPQAPPPPPPLPIPLPPQSGGGFGAHSAMWSEAARHQLRTVWMRQPGPPPARNDRDYRAEGDAIEAVAANNGAEREVAVPAAQNNVDHRVQREVDELVAEDDVDQRVEEGVAGPEGEQDSDESEEDRNYYWRGERIRPSLHANFDGSYFIILANRVTMEMSVNHCMRLRFSDVTVFINGDGSVCSITHANVRMVMNRGRVAGIFTICSCSFIALSTVTDQMFIAGEQGILFTASNLDNAYLVSVDEGLSSIPMSLLNFSLDALNEDITSIHFREFARIGRELFAAVRGIVEAARTYMKRPWKVNIYVHGAFIRYIFHGEVVFRHGACTLHYSRRKCFLNLKTPFMDMTITYNRQIEMKFGNKRIHVSRTGIMVADGARTATMDHFGRLISRT
ncbi:hypothetical protein Y032_0263g586 [Ancylostoma ceylanicum]|uniref:Uncharacterized protein n=1 Tax=Ancylostoma ceylanicum TaxID=53326 RepID=A0A016S9S3_9BILA|nr:hypothetical protein Y032_0263g586 [Ancylostoma ceylanicum]